MNGRYGILGGGFGMYGYLPAAASLAEGEISTLERYRRTIGARAELQPYASRVRFHDSFEEILSCVDVVILALPPFEQERVLIEIMARRWPGRLILEKPLAANPAAAQRLFDALRAAGYDFRIGFSFVWTDWYRSLAGWLEEKGAGAQEISVSWTFQAHHYQKGIEVWKRHPWQGGGALRFYGIQMVAAAAKLGAWDVAGCRRAGGADDEPDCEFSLQQGASRIKFRCDSNDPSSPRFVLGCRRLGTADRSIVRAGPFPPESTGGPAGADPRVACLRRVLESLNDDAGLEYQWYARHLQIWAALEQQGALDHC